MIYVTHKDLSLRPMLIVDVDANTTIEYLWNTSKSIGDLNKNALEYRNINTCPLDPGGMVNLNESLTQIEVNTFNFTLRLSTIGHLIESLKNAHKRFPTAYRVLQFRYFIILSGELLNKLISALEKLAMSDKALHAQINRAQLEERLEADKIMFFPRIPRENK